MNQKLTLLWSGLKAQGRRAVAGLAIMALVIGCGARLGEGNGEVSQEVATLESGLTALDGLFDDLQGGSSYGTSQSETCVRPILSSCSGGSQTYTYGGCTSSGTHNSYQGSTTLDYTGNNNCALDIGEVVTRDYNVLIGGPHGGILTVTSNYSNNYNGVSIGGGGTLSRTAVSTWSAEISGKHKTFKYGGQTRFKTSVHTSSAVTLTGALQRSLRLVNGGAVVVDHDLAGFTARYEPVNLRYSALCCHPTSGSLDVTYTGSVTGTATVTFSGCGSGTIIKGGTQTSFTLGYCE